MMISEKIYAHPWLYKKHPAINSTKLFGKTCFVNDKPSKLLQWNVLGEICTKGYIKLFSSLFVCNSNDHVTVLLHVTGLNKNANQSPNSCQFKTSELTCNYFNNLDIIVRIENSDDCFCMFGY